jgi:hypothetical protein
MCATARLWNVALIPVDRRHQLRDQIAEGDRKQVVVLMLVLVRLAVRHHVFPVVADQVIHVRQESAKD